MSRPIMNDYLDDYTSEAPNASLASTTTEFWTSENDDDVAQVLLKRVNYGFYNWLLQALLMLELMILITSIISIPTAITVVILNNSTKSVVVSGFEYWRDEKVLIARVHDQVNKKIKLVRAKEARQDAEVRKEAVKEIGLLEAEMERREDREARQRFDR